MQESTQAPGQLKTPKLLTRLHKITGIKPPSHLWSYHEPRATEPKQHKRDCDKKRNSRECNHNIVTVSTLTHVTVRGDTRRFLNDAPFHRRQVINSKTTYQERGRESAYDQNSGVGGHSEICKQWEVVSYGSSGRKMHKKNEKSNRR